MARPAASSAPADRPERVTWVDVLMLALAVASLVMLLVEQAFTGWFLAHPGAHEALIGADLAICGVFALEFAARLRRSDDRWGYVRSRWYEIVGMIPVSHPLFRGFRLLRILRIAVITSRFVRATNRSFGEMAFEAAVRRFQGILVDVVSDAILLRSLDTLEPLFARARLGDRVARAMDARQPELRAVVRRSLARMPGAERLRRVPFAGDIVSMTEAAALETVLATLRSEELNRIIQDATTGLLDELRVQVSADADDATAVAAERSLPAHDRRAA